MNEFDKRIGLNTDLKNISKEICKTYNIGDFVSNELITIGYEDYNYILTTNKGKYCVKIFHNERSEKDVFNYLERLKVVANNNINSPKPISINNDICYLLNYENNNYYICVFEYINGKNFYELGEKLSISEVKEIAKQTALINNIEIKPEFIYDSWAIINFEEEYSKKREYLNDELKKEFDELLLEFNKIEFDKLPKGFVHGDIINTNVIKDEKTLWIVDYAVSNYLPRIIDLAVISCNLCLSENLDETINKIVTLLNEYNKYNKLTEYEINCFGIFYKLANAMHILCTTYLIETEGQSEENNYWLNEGELGLSYSEQIIKKLSI